MSNEPTVKRWTAKRKAAVVMDGFGVWGLGKEAFMTSRQKRGRSVSN